MNRRQQDPEDLRFTIVVNATQIQSAKLSHILRLRAWLFPGSENVSVFSFGYASNKSSRLGLMLGWYDVEEAS